MALIAAMAVPAWRVHVVFSIAGFKGGEKPCPKTREIAGCGEASRKPRELSQVGTQASGTLA